MASKLSGSRRRVWPRITIASSGGCRRDDWHRFVFTNVVVAILFGAYLRKEIVDKEESRIRRLWVSRDEIRLFAEHCVYIRSVFEYYFRIFAEGTKAAMEAVAPRFFEDLAQVLNEFAISSACRVLKEAGAPPKLSQANYSGGLAEFVVIGFHWTPMMIESFRALMHKHKPKRLEFKMEGKCKVTVESEGFTDATTTRIIELVLEASRHQ